LTGLKIDLHAVQDKLLLILRKVTAKSKKQLPETTTHLKKRYTTEEDETKEKGLF